MMKREWVNAGAGVVAAMAAVGVLVVSMVTLAAGFAADVQASIDGVRADIQASVDVDAVRVDIQVSVDAVRVDIDAAQVENREPHAELDRKIENVGERIDRLYELLLARADR
jgi:hypothetical protein